MKKTLTKINTAIKLRHLFVIAIFLFSQKSFAQHFLQLDDGLGHYSLISGSNTGGTYTLPPGGGTLLTSGSTWLTAGNILTGGTPSTPNEFFGSKNNFDVAFRSNNFTRMTLGANGFFSIGASPTYPLFVYHPDATGTPPTYTQLIQTDLNPAATIGFNKDVLHLTSNLFGSSSNFTAVLDGLRQECFLLPTYTGTLDYAQGGNFAIYDQSPTTLANADAVIGSIFAQGGTAANIIGVAKAAGGQVYNLGAGVISNALATWGYLSNSGTGSITNGYLFYGFNPGTAGITNLTGIYLERLTGATNINAIVYAHPTLPFVVSGAGNVGIGTFNPGIGAKLSFGQTAGAPADIYFWDNGFPASRYGFGIQPSELQNFIPTGSHLSWNGGGDLQTSGTNELMRLTGTGNLGIGTLNPTARLQISQSVTTNPPGTVNLEQILGDISPSATHTNATQGLYLNNTVHTSAQNYFANLVGIRSETQFNADYTGTASYTQSGNFAIYFKANSPGLLGNADACIGSTYLQGSGNITTAHGVYGQVQNLGTGTITTASAFTAGLISSAAGPVTNGYLYYAINPGTAGMTNLTGLYIEQLTGATNINAILYAHPTLPFVVSGTGNVGIGTAIPGTGAKLSFGASIGSPANIFYWDGGVATSRYGNGMQVSELQNFIPTGSHFSWNAGGDLQPSGTNEIMRLTSSGNATFAGWGSFASSTTASALTTLNTGAQVAGATGASISNTATSNTGGINKIGLAVTSTGAWTGGAFASNYGIQLNVSGANAGFNEDIIGTGSSWYINPTGGATFSGLLVQGPADVNNGGANNINIGAGFYTGNILLGTGTNGTGANLTIGNILGTTSINGSNWGVTTAGAGTFVSVSANNLKGAAANKYAEHHTIAAAEIVVNSIVVTNTDVAGGTSVIIATLVNGTGGFVKTASAGAGIVTISFNAAPTAGDIVNYIVVNP